MDWTLLAVPLAGALRSISGWAENVFESKSDGGKKVTPLEWSQLASTIVRVSITGVGVYFATDLSGIESAGAALVGDFVLIGIKKLRM